MLASALARFSFVQFLESLIICIVAGQAESDVIEVTSPLIAELRR